VALGFSESAYWVRLPVINRSASERTWLLELGYPHLDHVELYVPTHDGGYEVRRTGDSLPFASREIADRYFVFELHEPRASARSYYLRVQSSGQVTVPLTAWTAASFRDHQNREQPLQWMFYGLLLVMALYNAFVYFSVREREYFYYVGYVLAYALFQATLNGHTFQYLLPNQVWLANRATPFFLGATVFWATRFWCRFLMLRHRARSSREGLSDVRPGRPERHAQVRRHGSRPLHLALPGRAARRTRVGGERARQRLHLLRAAATRAGTGRGRTRRRVTRSPLDSLGGRLILRA
jgi:hypothetical protein